MTTNGINSLWPSDIIWRQRSGSTLAQVMACCLTASSHYLNQCWLIISKVLWHSSEGIIMRRSEDTNQLNKIENYIFRITFRSPRGQWVNVSFPIITFVSVVLLSRGGVVSGSIRASHYWTIVREIDESLVDSLHTGSVLWKTFDYVVTQLCLKVSELVLPT